MPLKFDSQLSKVYSDSLMTINSLSLAAFPVQGSAMNKGKAAKLKLLLSENLYTLFNSLLRIKFRWHL